MKTFIFKLKHNAGAFKVQAYAHTLESAQNQVMEAEKCPLSALQLIRETETMYKVVKMFRVSGRRQVLERYLTETEAKDMVNSFPDSNNHIVMFMKQFQS